MSERRSGLDNPISWSFGVGRLFGIRIRMHLFFVFGAILVLMRAFHQAQQGVPWVWVGQGVGTLAILFLIVLLHEFGHCFGARFVGGQADEILMWPLGGLASVAPPHTARANLITAAAGPAVNVVICVVVGAILVVTTGSGWSVPWNPFAFAAPAVLPEAQWQWWLVIVFAVSYLLLLFNLAPVFPLDGGRVLQCLLWPSMGFQQSTKFATGIGMVGAIGFAAAGLISGQMLLLGIAIFGYLTCWQQRQMLKMGGFADEGEFGYDFSQGYTSLERSEPSLRRPGYFARRRAARAVRRELREQRRLEAQRREVDRILTKISEHGADSLTPPERRILERETERQRSGSS
ncbi:MAG: hypothetical protein IID40_10540 [Planctomycetes bacterium]|nr:hypothetical protein [Planctomycetota bacterium]